MSICKQCGEELSGAKFCPICGAPANGVAVAQQAAFSGGDARQQSMAAMER